MAVIKNMDMEDVLMLPQNFKRVCDLTENEVPNAPGIYTIRICNVHDLDAPFCDELIKRGHNLLYVGIASKSLRERLWKQELNHKRPATFFRSMGAILGYRPEKGSLVDESNKRNYRFTIVDTKKIQKWMKEHLLVNFMVQNEDLGTAEEYLIVNYKPIVNIQKNPNKMEEVKRLREECVRIANSRE